MTDQITDDDLAAAIVALGVVSKDGLSPQGEAAVRLALRCAALQKQLERTRVEIEEELNQPTRCKVYVDGVLKFSGRDYSQDIRMPATPGEMALPAEQHYALLGNGGPTDPTDLSVPSFERASDIDEPEPEKKSDEWGVDF